MDLEPSLYGVDLTDSFILDWRYKGDSLIFDLEASLWPGNVAYETPKPYEYTCYKKARLVFAGVRKISGLKQKEDIVPTKDQDGSVDYGCIGSYRYHEPTTHILCGDFGHVELVCISATFEVISTK